MERLWTPWRMTYVGGAKHATCIFCDALAAGDDVARLILMRGERAFLILNLYPYNSGHAMAVPYAHAATLEDLDADTRAELMELATELSVVAKRVLRCDGFNLGLNIGAVAGAGVAEHLHVHVVPRWLGDANFMPILAGTMVIPELLPVTYARLRAELEGRATARTGDVTLTAGAIVVLPGGRVAVRRGRGGVLVLPKGKVEGEETLAQAALREVREETGIDATLTGWAGSTTFDHDGRRYYAAYFLASGRETPELAEHLERDTVLVPVDDLPERLEIPALQELARQRLTDLRRLAGHEA